MGEAFEVEGRIGGLTTDSSVFGPDNDEDEDSLREDSDLEDEE